MVIALHKPYRMLSQFNANPDQQNQKTLREIKPPLPTGLSPIGRLDYDSEGLLLLSDDTSLEHQLLSPQHSHLRTYCVQIDGQITPELLQTLSHGSLTIRVGGKPHKCKPCLASLEPSTPPFEPRTPPVDATAEKTSSWISLTLTEGKNRQVRRMTAAIGHPTLRLIRTSIGEITLTNLELGSGQWVIIPKSALEV